jgi:hypothetical protein
LELSTAPTVTLDAEDSSQARPFGQTNGGIGEAVAERRIRPGEMADTCAATPVVSSAIFYAPE